MITPEDLWDLRYEPAILASSALLLTPADQERFEAMVLQGLFEDFDYEEQYLEGQFELNKQLREFALELPDAQAAALKQQVAALAQDLQETEEVHATLRASDAPLWLIESMLDLAHYFENRSKLSSLLIRLERPETAPADQLTSQEIALAKQVPFGRLLKFDRTGKALCPFHNEKTPSFHWYKNTNSAFCFSCRWAGDPIKFIRESGKLSFKEAVRRLNRM